MRMVVSSLSSMPESCCQLRHIDPIDNGEVSMFRHKMDHPGVAASRDLVEAHGTVVLVSVSIPRCLDGLLMKSKRIIGE
jgi:hypothetical protein